MSIKRVLKTINVDCITKKYHEVLFFSLVFITIIYMINKNVLQVTKLKLTYNISNLLYKQYK